MVLRFEVNQIGDVRGRGALRFLRVTQTGAGGAHRFVLALNSITFERCRAPKWFSNKLCTVFLLPQPIFDRRQRRVDELVACRSERD